MKIKDILAKHVNVKVDRKFMKTFLVFKSKFEHKNVDNINFFGGNLLGVYLATYSDLEESVIWVEDILGIEQLSELQREYHDNEEIVPSRGISGNVVNALYLYMAHRALTSPDLSKGDQQRLSHEILMMLQYKFLTSIHKDWFKFRAREDVALATYESLSRKFQLKRAGTWKGLIELRSDNILDKDSIHMDVLKTFNDDKRIVGALNDIQGRIKSILIEYYSAFKDQLNKEAKIVSSGSFIEIDGDRVMKDRKNDYQEIRDSIKRCIILLIHR